MTDAAARSHRCVFVRRTWPHWAQHGGYDRLFPAIEEALGARQLSCYANPGQAPSRVSRHILSRIGRHAIWSGESYQAPHAVAAELRALWTAWRYRPEFIQIGEMETSFGLLGNRRVRSWLRDTRVVATAHLPASWWRLYGEPRIVGALDGLVTVSTSQREFFSSFLPGRVWYIPHGIDTTFFTPTERRATPAGEFRCLCVGELYRDMPLLAEVVERVTDALPGTRFDLVYPNHGRARDRHTLLRIARHPQVHWHSGLSDEQLRNLYQQADLLVIPLVECTANNAILEAIACGLPVVTSDLPGVRDYVTPAFARLSPPHEAAPMAQNALELLANPSLRAEMGRAARSHAEAKFAWPVVARQWVGLYAELARLPRR